jgi:transposase
MHRHQLTDEQWSIVEPLIPKKHASTGRPPANPREMLDGILWILRTGAPWRDLPERFGPCKTVFDYYSNWRKSGVFDRVVEALQIRLDRQGKIDWDLWCIDGSHVRAARCAAGAEKKVTSVMRTKASRRTTRWAAAAADSAANSTWSLTATAFRWPSK